MARWALPRYLVAALAVRTADEGARVSLVLLALDRTGSAATGGLLVAALLVPHVLAAPVVGAAIDRAARPRRLLAVAVLGFAASLFAVGVLIGRAPIWVCVVCLLLGGCCGPAVTGGLTSELPGIVGGAGAPRAFALDSLFYNVAGMAGPAVVGVTAAAAGAVTGQLALAGSALVGAALVAMLPIPSREGRGSRTADGAALTQGVRWIAREPTLRIVTVSSAVGQLGAGGLGVVAAVLAASLHQPVAAGLLLAAVAVGSCVGSLLWAWRPLPPARAPLVTTTAMIGTGLALAASAASSSIAVTAVLFGLSGLFVGPFAAALFTVRADFSPEALRSQVFTIGAGLKVTASALGAALIGLGAALPTAAQLLIIAGSPLVAGLGGTARLRRAHSAAIKASLARSSSGVNVSAGEGSAASSHGPS